jgi:membrane-bound lytic murein transglycosylase B
VFLPLRQWLAEQGVNIKQADAWLSAPQVRFEGRLLASMLSHTEISRDYKNFFTGSSLRRARDFKSKYVTVLEHTRELTSVPQEIIVAIILVESNLGQFTGKTCTFNALASQAVLDTPEARNIMSNSWPENKRDYLHSEAALTRFAQRAAWARQELLALLRLAHLWQKEIWDIKGSPAGALGWCQFVPTSIERWGADGSGDGQVNLNNPLDAIASVGRYLREHGWQADLSYQQRLDIILTYNKSTAYATAVMQLAEKL